MSAYPKAFERGKNRLLTQAQAEELRRRAWAGEDRRLLSAEYGVCVSAVSRIKHRQAYWEPGSFIDAARGSIQSGGQAPGANAGARTAGGGRCEDKNDGG